MRDCTSIKKPTGQGGAPLELSREKMNKDEQKVLGFIYTRKGPRELRTIREIQTACFKGKNSSPTRNALRRLVRSGWIEKPARGKYRLTERGRKRGQRKKR